MIVEYIRYVLTTHSPDDLVAAYARALEHLKAAPECLGVELSRCAEDANTLILRLEWTSPDGHLKGFRTGPHFPPFLAEIRPFIGEIAEMRHYEVTDVTWRDRAPA